MVDLVRRQQSVGMVRPAGMHGRGDGAYRSCTTSTVRIGCGNADTLWRPDYKRKGTAKWDEPERRE